MKIKFREPKLSGKNFGMLDGINLIIDEYRQEGYRLTLRQLYYQLVSRDLIPNLKKEYDKLSHLLKEGRMGGLVDWDAIEDRLRVPNIPYSVEGIQDAIDDTINQYRLDRQKNQDVYIELWCEKDALSNVLKRMTHKYHIKLMINRGYSSCTAMFDAYNRLNKALENHEELYILYLGDHDPSGLDMIRDIQNRLDEFGINPNIIHIGLTKEQIELYKPPPNPAKFSDPRANDYVAKHGRISWEVDALTPQVLHSIVESNIVSLIDKIVYAKMLAEERYDKNTLGQMMEERGIE